MEQIITFESRNCFKMLAFIQLQLEHINMEQKYYNDIPPNFVLRWVVNELGHIILHFRERHKCHHKLAPRTHHLPKQNAPYEGSL